MGVLLQEPAALRGNREGSRSSVKTALHCPTCLEARLTFWKAPATRRSLAAGWGRGCGRTLRVSARVQLRAAGRWVPRANDRNLGGHQQCLPWGAPNSFCYKVHLKRTQLLSKTHFETVINSRATTLLDVMQIQTKLYGKCTLHILYNNPAYSND